MAHLVPSQERQKQRQRDLYKFKAREFQLSQGYIVRLVSERHTGKNTEAERLRVLLCCPVFT